MPVTEERIRPARVVVTALVALMFAITQLPDVIEKARPELLLLLVIYWSLSAPRIAGLTFAWVCGLALDLLTGPILGQHALAFLLVAFLTHKFQLRMRVFPIWHQTLTVFMLLALYEFIVFWIDGIIGPAITTWTRWLPVLTSTLLWPVLVAFLDTWNRRRNR
ncbi:MAG: rod shape-determining protein MreD [Gammaproteobacteria bacterium]|nr:rod shape-determining protein MreD [Gammaproteobacteria bacterium]